MSPDLWLSVVEAGTRNPEVLTPMPRKWTPTRLRQLRKIHEYLDGNWQPLIEAVRSATNKGAEHALDLSLERLTTKDCERLDSLLSGKWRDPKAGAKAAAESREEAERRRSERTDRMAEEALERARREGKLR